MPRKFWSWLPRQVFYLSPNRYGYVVFLIFATALMFFKNVAYASILSVDQFGRFSKYFVLATALAAYGGLGMQQLAHKRMPQILGRRHFIAAQYLTMGGVAVFGACALIVVGACPFVGMLSGGGSASCLDVLLAALYGLSMCLFTYALIAAKSALNFAGYGVMTAVRATLLLTVGVVVAWVTDTGLLVMAAEALVTAGVVLWWFYRQRLFGRSCGPLRLGRLRIWLRAAFPSSLRLLVLNGTLLAGLFIDRWIGAAWLSDERFGVYSAAALFLTAYQTTQTVLNVSLYPRMSRLIGQREVEAAYRVAKRWSLALWTLAAVGFVPAVFVGQWVARYLWPDYIGIVSLLPLLMAAGTLRVGDFFGSFCVLCDAEAPVAHTLLAFYAATIAIVVGVAVLGREGSFTVYTASYLAVALAGVSVIVHVWFAKRLMVKRGGTAVMGLG